MFQDLVLCFEDSSAFYAHPKPSTPERLSIDLEIRNDWELRTTRDARTDPIFFCFSITNVLLIIKVGRFTFLAKKKNSQKLLIVATYGPTAIIFFRLFNTLDLCSRSIMPVYT